MYKIIFITCLSIINIFSFIQCGSLLGRAGIMYTTTHNNFRDQQGAFGLVRMTNGFSVVTPASGVGSTHGSCAFMDTCISVSGAIDLRETNTIFLQADLILDHGVTFSSSGNIYGYDRALILNGDLTIPDGKIIHTGGRVVIDGNGHKLLLGNSAQLFVDTDATLTLRNLVLQNTRNQPGHPAVQCASSGSKLCLEDVELALADDFYFDRGQIFIHNDVAVTGTSAFVYRSCRPSFITSKANLYFDIGTTFSVAPATFTDCYFSTFPTTTTNNFIQMTDKTSLLHLNGCNFLTTLTGCRLTNGSLYFENHVLTRSNASNTFNSIGSVYTTSIGTTPQSICASWSPDGRFIAVTNGFSVNTLQIYKFDGISAPTAVGGTVASRGASVFWSPDGRFIASTDSSGRLSVFSFNGTSTPIQISSETVNGISALSWSPDGRYIAIVEYSSNLLAIFRFSPTGTLIRVATTTVSGTFTRALSWSSDGRFIAVGNDSTGIQIYNFDGANILTKIGGAASVPNSPESVTWSPDGRFIAVGLYNFGLRVFRFDGRGAPILVGSYGGSCGGGPQSVTWSHDGRFIALVNGSQSNTLQIYSFDGVSTVNQLVSIGTLTYPESVSWSPNGNFIAVVNRTSSALRIYSINYTVNTGLQAFTKSIVFGNSALGPNYDLNIRMLGGAQTIVDGILNDDNVN